MTSEEFIARAEAISADPLSRVPEKFRPLAQSGRALATVTAHCSTGTVHAYFRRIKNIPGWKIASDGTLTDRPETRWFILFQKIGYENYFNHPKNWEPVLERFPDLKINFAHFGGYRQMSLLISPIPMHSPILRGQQLIY